MMFATNGIRQQTWRFYNANRTSKNRKNEKFIWKITILSHYRPVSAVRFLLVKPHKQQSPSFINMGQAPQINTLHSSNMSRKHDGILLPSLSIHSCTPKQNGITCTTENPFSFGSLQDLLTSTTSRFNDSNLLPTRNELPSIEDAQVTLDRAVIALNARYYQDALKLYLEGGYAMANAVEIQSSPTVRDLVARKAFETLEWCISLSDLIEGQEKDQNPRPGVHKVGMPVASWNEDWVGSRLSKEESRCIWYTPVRCPDPSDFSNLGYRLRCVETGRNPQLLICITMYNEGPQQLQATLTKLANNLAYLMDQNIKDKRKSFAGEDAWQNVLVCIVADGREQIHDEMLTYLKAIGLYNEDLLNINSAGIGAQCHLFEHTLQLSAKGKNLPPIQTIFALKDRKGSKLDSHQWFFNAFAEQIQPQFTALIDVGSMLNKSAIYQMLLAFERNPQIGGACGQIAVEKPLENLSNWIISAQNFEYKISSILDSSMESCFGFITVLPGAFSVYRFEAIRGAPLEAYFKTLQTELGVYGPFVGNMYLAEDRILSFEVVARKNCNWTLHYVKDAVARTDVPQDLIALILQRKRWLNGTLCNTLFNLSNWGRIFSESNHSSMRKLAFSFFFLYYLLSTAFTFFMPATFYLMVYFIVFQGFQQNRLGFVDTSQYTQAVRDDAVGFCNLLYLFGLLILIIVALGNNPKQMKLAYYAVCTTFALIVIASILVGLSAYMSMQVTVQSIVSTTLTAGVFIIGPALHGELHHILLTYAHYITLVPSFINVFTIYSFCNLHDLSWGTKGLHSDPLLAASLENRGMGTCKGGAAERRALKKSSSEESERLKDRKERFEAFRTKMLFLWISANLSIAVYVVYFSSSSAFFPKIFNFMAGINSCRLLGCIGHCLYIHTNVLRDSVFDKVKVFMVPTAIRKIRACTSTPLLQAITVPIPHYQGLEITTDYFGSRVKRGITRRGERRP